MATPLDGLDSVGARKPRLMAFLVIEQIEAMRDAIAADTVTVNAAITTAEGGADKAAVVALLATVKTDATALAATRVAAINVELAKLKDAIS